jgi:hypothetical protein
MMFSSAWALNTYSNGDDSSIIGIGEKVEQMDVYEKVRSIRGIEDGFHDLSNDTSVDDSVKTTPKKDLYDVYYAYPSAGGSLPYRQYKVTVLKTIWNYFSFNPKGTYEGELTSYTDNDFDAVTGEHKDSFTPSCISPKQFIISIE